jgi:hypothetical protein
MSWYFEGVVSFIHEIAFFTLEVYVGGWDSLHYSAETSALLDVEVEEEEVYDGGEELAIRACYTGDVP